MLQVPGNRGQGAALSCPPSFTATWPRPLHEPRGGACPRWPKRHSRPQGARQQCRVPGPAPAYRTGTCVRTGARWLPALCTDGRATLLRTWRRWRDGAAARGTPGRLAPLRADAVPGRSPAARTRSRACARACSSSTERDSQKMDVTQTLTVSRVDKHTGPRAGRSTLQSQTCCGRAP